MTVSRLAKRLLASCQDWNGHKPYQGGLNSVFSTPQQRAEGMRQNGPRQDALTLLGPPPPQIFVMQFCERPNRMFDDDWCKRERERAGELAIKLSARMQQHLGFTVWSEWNDNLENRWACICLPDLYPTAVPHYLLQSIQKRGYILFIYIPVVPHKAVAEVSRIGNV